MTSLRKSTHMKTKGNIMTWFTSCPYSTGAINSSLPRDHVTWRHVNTTIHTCQPSSFCVQHCWYWYMVVIIGEKSTYVRNISNLLPLTLTLYFSSVTIAFSFRCCDACCIWHGLLYSAWRKSIPSNVNYVMHVTRSVNKRLKILHMLTLYVLMIGACFFR